MAIKRELESGIATKVFRLAKTGSEGVPPLGLRLTTQPTALAGRERKVLNAPLWRPKKGRKA